jgi:hypothetical protein
VKIEVIFYLISNILDIDRVHHFGGILFDAIVDPTWFEAGKILQFVLDSRIGSSLVLINVQVQKLPAEWGQLLERCRSPEY